MAGNRLDMKDVEEIGIEYIRPLKYYSGGFDIQFTDIKFPETPEFLLWLKAQGYDRRDPTLALGWLKIAKLDLSAIRFKLSHFQKFSEIDSPRGSKVICSVNLDFLDPG